MLWILAVEKSLHQPMQYQLWPIGVYYIACSAKIMMDHIDKNRYFYKVFLHIAFLPLQFWLVGFFAIACNVDFGFLHCLPIRTMLILVPHHIACNHCKCPLPNSSIFHTSFYVEETSAKIVINFRLEHLTRRTRYFGVRTSHRWCLTTKRGNAISSTARRSVRPFRMTSRRSCR